MVVRAAAGPRRSGSSLKARQARYLPERRLVRDESQYVVAAEPHGAGRLEGCVVPVDVQQPCRVG